MFWLQVGFILGFLAVLLGAFGAHGLRKRVSSEKLVVYQTGVQYQMYHAFAMIVVGILQIVHLGSSVFNDAGFLYLLGTILFSGSLYLLSVTSFKKIGMMTPLGGVCFLLGWVFAFLGITHV